MLPRPVALWLLPRAASLPAPLARAVARAAHDDDEVAAAAALLDRVGSPSGLSGAQKDRVFSAVFAAVEEEQTQTQTQKKGAWSLAPLSAAAACAVLFVVVKAPVDTVDDLAARGDTSAPLGVRVRCVKDGAVVDDASAGARQTGGSLDCPDGSLLAFSTTNLQGAPRYAFVVGIDDSGAPVWLPPFSRDSSARAVPAGSADSVVDTLAPLPSRALTLFVLLDDEAFDGDDVERRLAQARRNGTPLDKLERLPLDVQSQGRLLLRPLSP